VHAGHFGQECHHKVRMYKEYHSVCPLVGIGTPPTPLSQASVPLPPRTGGGHTRLRVRGWGRPISDDWRKSLPLCLYSVDVTKLFCPTVISPIVTDCKLGRFTSHYCILPARDCMCTVQCALCNCAGIVKTWSFIRASAMAENCLDL
jgi:hypothetical protein